jgi:hypothetical protein
VHASHEALTLHSPVAHPALTLRSPWLTLIARCECLKRHGVGEREGELGADFSSVFPPTSCTPGPLCYSCIFKSRAGAQAVATATTGSLTHILQSTPLIPSRPLFVYCPSTETNYDLQDALTAHIVALIILIQLATSPPHQVLGCYNSAVIIELSACKVHCATTRERAGTRLEPI